MPDNIQPNDSSSTPVNSEASTSNTSPTGAPASTGLNKRLLVIIGSIIGFLLLLSIILIIALLGKDKYNDNDETNNATDKSDSKQSGNSSDGASESGRVIQKRVASSDPKLEYIIYKPQQNAANTTLYFAVENVCEGCDDTSGVYSVVNSYDHKSNSYLLDDNNGKKYGTITDEDGDVLATPSCNEWIKSGEKQECFVAFSKVPSGSTVSWVFGKSRIDGIKVE